VHWRYFISVNIARIFTHPVDAALELPSLRCAQEGLKKFNLMTLDQRNTEIPDI
jgi:hypothetical protein